MLGEQTNHLSYIGILNYFIRVDKIQISIIDLLCAFIHVRTYVQSNSCNVKKNNLTVETVHRPWSAGLKYLKFIYLINS